MPEIQPLSSTPTFEQAQLLYQQQQLAPQLKTTCWMCVEISRYHDHPTKPFSCTAQVIEQILRQHNGNSSYFFSVVHVEPSDSHTPSNATVLCSIICSIPLPVRYMEQVLSEMRWNRKRDEDYQVKLAVHNISRRMNEESTLGVMDYAPPLIPTPVVAPHHITLNFIDEKITTNVQHDLPVDFFRGHDLQFWREECPDDIYLSIFRFLPITDLVNVNVSCRSMHRKVNAHDGVLWKMYFSS